MNNILNIDESFPTSLGEFGTILADPPWRFANRTGKIAPEYIDPADNPLGIDPNDPKGLDDLYASELHFPVQRPVIAELTSKDVIHSFSIPVLRVKQDVIPGMRIPVWFRAKETGNYEIACSQLCGNNHYSMRALMTIHDSEDAFEQWLVEQIPEIFDEDE